MWILEKALMFYGAFKMIVEIGGYIINKIPFLRRISRLIILRWRHAMYSTEPGIEHLLEDVKDLLKKENVKHRFLSDKRIFYVYPRHVTDRYSDDQTDHNSIGKFFHFVAPPRTTESVLLEIAKMVDAFGYKLNSEKKGENGIITVKIIER